MINKKFSDIELSDIQSLIDNTISEGKTIDYKEDYSLGNEREKGEFLADVSSFANTAGGDLVFGIGETEGIAREIKYIEGIDKDIETQKMENIIREGIDPRINIDIKFIDSEPGKCVIVIRIQKSFIGPHRVIFNQYPKTKDQFYARNSAGKFQLDTRQLREAFVLSDNLNDRIKKFKDERIMAILSEDTPVPINDGAKIIIHIVPLDTFNGSLNIKFSNSTQLGPIRSSGWNYTNNLDGWITYSGREGESTKSYTQAYRNGVVEIVTTSLFRLDGSVGMIPSLAYEQELRSYLPKCFQFLNGYDVNPPFAIFITFTGVKGFKLGVGNDFYNHEDAHRITRDVINFPEIYIQEGEENIDTYLIPIFDVIWNSFGYPRSMNYTEEGVWRYDANGNRIL